MALLELLPEGLRSCDLRVLAIAISILTLLYLIGNAIYQIYFSPLSKFPGPKLAAATLWYEIYYDVFKWGRYYVEIEKMHQKYGPIIRINPFELHVSDPDFIDTLYTRSAPRDRHSYMTRQFGNDLVTFSTEDHAHHRIRRAAISPFFSKQRVMGLQDLIWAHVEKLCKRFEEFKMSGTPLPTSQAFGCLTADVIIEYSMGLQQNALDDPEFAPLFTQAVRKFASLGIITKHAPWMHKVIEAIPQHWVAKMSPELGATLAFRAMNNQRVREVFERNEKAGKSSLDAHDFANVKRTIFDDLFYSDLPPEEKNLERLSQESQIIVGAGLDTTAHAMNIILFHLLENPSKLHKLRRELEDAMPDPHARTPLVKLEQLPYFSAVISEGLRLSYGISSRNARIAREPMVYKSYVIPPGIPVGMTVPLTHHDESIFPDSHSFIPERWIHGKTPDGRPLEKFLMTFGRGSRQCAGMNLARAEMHIALAALLRRFEMELWESSRMDVDMVHDLFIPGADSRSKGVKVLVQ